MTWGSDAAGQITSVTPWGAAASSYGYASDGALASVQRPLTAVAGSTLATSWSYDTARRLTGILHKDGAGATIENLSYLLDGNGNRTRQTDQTRLAGGSATPATYTTNYTYDVLNRLT